MPLNDIVDRIARKLNEIVGLLESNHDEAVRISNELHPLYQAAMLEPEMHAARCFMFEIHGHDEMATLPEDKPVEQIIQEADGDLPALVTKLGGGLAASVRQFIEERTGERIAECGGGSGHWHIGAHVTPGQAWLLYNDTRVRFDKAIKAGMLTPYIIPWGIREV